MIERHANGEVSLLECDERIQQLRVVKTAGRDGGSSHSSPPWRLFFLYSRKVLLGK